MIHSGKLRRYNNLSLLRQLLRPVTIVMPNVRDMGLVLIGFFESLVRLLFWRPDVIFTKGGYVCLPVGMAAKVLKIPLVIHDSDAHPGLTNRILAKWATSIGTGAPLKYYAYPESISKYVGIPVDEAFRKLSAQEKNQAKQNIGVDTKRPLLVITGGGLGAKRLNDAAALSLSKLLSVCSVVLISGTKQYDELRSLTPHNNDKFQLHAFISRNMAEFLGAADVVVARAGATTILELAALATPTVLVPNGYLTGGHQLKNAAAYAENGAVKVIDEHALDTDVTLLFSTVKLLLSNNAERHTMGQKFHAFSRPDAAKDMAAMIIEAAKQA